MQATKLTIDITDKPGVFTLRVRAHGDHSPRAERARTAATFRLASELERIAGEEDRAYTVDASCALEGVVLVNLPANVEVDTDIMYEICVDAASASGLSPTEE